MKPKIFSTVLLDWDGCMAKTLQVWMDTYIKTYKAEGKTVTPKDIIQHSWGNLVEGLRYFGVKNPEAAWKQIVDTVQVGVQTVPLYPSVKETILALKRKGKKMAIVTSSERRLLDPALEHHGLLPLIDVVITEKDVTKPKPDPEMLFLALTKLESNSHEAVIIGDSSKDIMSGKNAGVATILMLHPENEQFYNFNTLKQLNPDFTATRFSDLLSFVG